MAQNCTILCPADEPRRIVDLVKGIAGGRGQVAVTGDDSNWSSIKVETPGATLTLHRKLFRSRGDDFSKMRLGMWAHLERVETKHTAVKLDVLRRIEEFVLAIGVGAEPGFVEEAGHYECIFGLAEALDAVIWNGSGVLNSEGQLLLDGEGNCEVLG